MMNMNFTAKDIKIGIVSAAAFIGMLFILLELLGKELFLYIVLAVVLGLMSYLIAAWLASKRKLRQLECEEEELER